jgi:hypothetical protein
MKNSIKLTALLLVLSTGLFAADVPKTDAPANNAIITFSAMPRNRGVEVKVDKSAIGKAVVIISDKYGDVLLNDVMPKYATMQRSYVLNRLESGDYTMEVIYNKQVVKKDIHIYDEDHNRVFIMNQ